MTQKIKVDPRILNIAIETLRTNLPMDKCEEVVGALRNSIALGNQELINETNKIQNPPPDKK